MPSLIRFNSRGAFRGYGADPALAPLPPPPAAPDSLLKVIFISVIVSAATQIIVARLLPRNLR